MSKKKTIAELRASCNSKKPVEYTVVKRWEDIIASLANGWSFAKIAEALRTEGEDVGNEMNTGFTTAVKRVAERKGVDLKLLRNAHPSDSGLRTERVAMGSLPTAGPLRKEFEPESKSNETDSTNDVLTAASPIHGEPSKSPASPAFGDTRYISDF